MPVHVPGTADAVKVSLLWLTQGQNMVNTFNVFDPSGTIFSDLLTFGDNVNAAVAAHILPIMRASVAYLGCDVEDIRTTTFSGITASAAPGTAGTLTAVQQLPGNVTWAVKKLTAGLGRSGRGRWYFVGMDTADLGTSDFISSSRANAIIAGLVAFQTAVEAIHTGLEMGIVSYFHNKVLRAAGLFEQITNWAYADLVLDSQRRRLPGRGR